MSKVSIAIFALIFIGIYFLIPIPTKAGTIENIGDIPIGETKDITVSGLFEYNSRKLYYLEITGPSSFKKFYCFNTGDNGNSFHTIGRFDTQGRYHIVVTRTPSATDCSSAGPPEAQADFNVIPSKPIISPIGDLQINEEKEVTVSNLTPKTNYVWVEKRKVGRDYKEEYKECDQSDGNGVIKGPIGPFNQTQVGSYKLEIYERKSTVCQYSILDSPIVSKDFSVGQPSGTSCCVAPFGGYDPVKDQCGKIVGRGQVSPTDRQPTECSKEGTFCDASSLQCFKSKPPPAPGLPKPSVSPAIAAGKPCPDPPDPKNPGIQTAIGCIHTSPVGFIKDFLKFIIGISGGLAFLMMLLGTFQMLSSAGNPETLAAGKDRLTNAVIGLLIVIFSVLLLRIIGVDILGLPGFGPK